MRSPDHIPTPEDSYESEKQPVSLESRILRAIQEGRAQQVGAGSTGDVRILTSKETEENTPWVVKTRVNDPPSHQKQRATFATEWKIHQQAHAVLQTISAEKQHLFAKIPQPVAIINTLETQRMILEYITGETLFERALKYLLLRYADEDETGEIMQMRREALVDLAVSDAYIDVFPEEIQRSIRWALKQSKETVPPLTEEHFDEIIEAGKRAHNGVPFLSSKQYSQIQATIDVLHAHNISHGDLHPSNVMIQANGDTVIIDFGLAKRSTQPNGKAAKEDKTYLKLYKNLAL